MLLNLFKSKNKNEKYNESAMLCKICKSDCSHIFSLPKNKKSGSEIPNIENDAHYYECSKCGFLFSDVCDTISEENIYNDEYWNNQDPDWGGRVYERCVWQSFLYKILKLNLGRQRF